MGWSLLWFWPKKLSEGGRWTLEMGTWGETVWEGKIRNSILVLIAFLKMENYFKISLNLMNRRQMVFIHIYLSIFTAKWYMSRGRWWWKKQFLLLKNLQVYLIYSGPLRESLSLRFLWEIISLRGPKKHFLLPVYHKLSDLTFST